MKPNLRVINGDGRRKSLESPVIIVDDIVDTGPETMKRAAQLMRLIEARAAAQTALEIIATEGGLPEVFKFLRSEVKRFQEYMQP